MKFYLLPICFVAFLLSATTTPATSLKPLNLEELSTQAPLIFYGEAIKNEVKNDAGSGQIATFTTFKVIELIKGQANAEHTIKQIGGRLPRSNIKMHVPGVPKFSTGKKYVVFLAEKSRLGFSSPLGLYQGTFSVDTIDGQQVVSNGSRLSAPPVTSIKPVQVPLAVNPENPAQSSLSSFINSVRAYNAK